MEQTYVKTSMGGMSLIAALVFVNANLMTIVNAQSAETKDVFKVIVSLSGITSSTKDMLILVNVKDQTKSELFNAENPELKRANKVNYTLTFAGSSVDEGDKYTVCIVSVKNFNLQCDDAKNSPLNKPEFVDINLSTGDSDNEEKGKENKKA
jgi:hypothetical protein